MTAGALFDEQERAALTAALAATGGTAELLGRARVRERQSQALARGGPQTFAESAFAFADDPAAGLKPLAPEAAVKHFRALVPQLGVDPERFGVEQRRRAFTVAQATEQSLLGRLKDLILRSLEGTASPQPWGEQAVRDLLDQAGVTPRNPQYAEMVFRTNMMDAYTQGATDELQDPDVAETFPVWRYDGIDDHRAGDDHRPKFGRYYPNAVAFAVVRGQRVYNCRCVPTPIDRWTWEQLQREGARVETSWFASAADGFASFYHGPQPPGPGWTLAHEGPRGGKVWQRAPKPAEKQPAKKPAADKPKRPTVDEAHADIQGLLGKKRLTAQATVELAGRLEQMTVKDLTALKARLGLKASGAKSELARKIAERALAQAKTDKAPKPAPKTAAKPRPAAKPKPAAPPPKKPQPKLGNVEALPPKAQAYLQGWPHSDSQWTNNFTGSGSAAAVSPRDFAGYVPAQGKAVIGKVNDAVKATAPGLGDNRVLKDVYALAAKSTPGLTVPDFQATIMRLVHEGELTPRIYTRALTEIDLNHAIPMDREVLWAVRPVRK